VDRFNKRYSGSELKSKRARRADEESAPAE
jgi:hypothetical protein